jgi:hypothetical protein
MEPAVGGDALPPGAKPAVACAWGV